MQKLDLIACISHSCVLFIVHHDLAIRLEERCGLKKWSLVKASMVEIYKKVALSGEWEPPRKMLSRVGEIGEALNGRVYNPQYHVVLSLPWRLVRLRPSIATLGDNSGVSQDFQLLLVNLIPRQRRKLLRKPPF